MRKDGRVMDLNYALHYGWSRSSARGGSGIKLKSKVLNLSHIMSRLIALKMVEACADSRGGYWGCIPFSG